MLKLADRIRGCLIGAAAGDALGMPVETMSRTAILTALGPRGVTGFLAPIQTRIADTRHLPAGSITDDTDSLLGVAASLLRKDGFDLTDQAEEMVRRVERGPYGCGPTTRRAVREVGNFLFGRPGPCREPAMPAPAPISPTEGCGNGVSLKIAPLVIWCYANRQPTEVKPLVDWILQMGTMTHGDPRASFAAAALGGALAGLLRVPESLPLTPEMLRFAVLRIAHRFAFEAEQRWHYFRPHAPSVSDRLETAALFLDDAEALRRTIGTGPNALESVPFAIATYLRHPFDFSKAVLEAVNAGGDTDSTAAMVGALVGMTVGLTGLPLDFTLGLPAYWEVMATANALIKALSLEP